MSSIPPGVPPNNDTTDEQADLDTDLLDYLQTLTPAERMARHEGAQELIRALRRAGEKHYGVDPRTLATPSR